MQKMHEHVSDFENKYQVVKKCISNLFAGSPPDHVVFGDNKGYKNVRIGLSTEQKDELKAW